MVTCLAGAGTRRTRRWVVVRRGTPGGPVTVLRRRPGPAGTAAPGAARGAARDAPRGAAEEVRIHLLTPGGALVPVVLTDDGLTDDVLTDDVLGDDALTDDAVGVRTAGAQWAPDADPGRR